MQGDVAGGLARRPTIEALEPRLLLDGMEAMTTQQAMELLSLSPALFVENQGQWADPAVYYLANSSGASAATADADIAGEASVNAWATGAAYPSGSATPGAHDASDSAFEDAILAKPPLASFTDIGAGLSGVVFCSLAWGDYDNDGDLDLALAGGSISRIYRNDGGAFTDIGAGLTGVYVCSLAWGTTTMTATWTWP